MRVLAAALSMLVAAGARAAEGVVLLPDGSPAVDATVSILGQPGSTRTGADGRFTWVPEPQPPLDVLVILSGGVYAKPVTVEALPADGSPFVVRLRLMTSEALTVEAGATPFTEAPPASAAAIVTADDMGARRPDCLTRAIEAMPGVGRLEEGHTAVPSIRGLARGRTLILLDGARVTAERRAGPSATYLDPADLEAIEVARGFGSVAWGSDAFGGVIHARSRAVAPGSGLGGRFEAAAGAGVAERRLGAEVSRGFAEGGLLAGVRWRESDDYHTPEGVQPNSAWRDAGGRMRFDHEWGPGRLGLLWQGDYGRDIGKPAQDSEVIRAYYPREDSNRFALSYDGDPRGGLTRWGARAFLDGYRLVTFRDRYATAVTARQLAESDVRARDWGLRASATTSLSDWRVEGGLDLNGRFRLEATGAQTVYDGSGQALSRSEETSIEDASRSDLGAFLTVDGRLVSRLSAALGGRLDRVRSRNTGGYFGDQERKDVAASGFVALTLGPLARITTTAQVGRGFRDPLLSDRYFRGTSGRGFVSGNPDLEPEMSLQYDLALRRPGRVRSALYLYHYRIDDLIERYREGSDFFFRNRGRAVLRGVELELQTDVRGLGVELGAYAASGEAEDGSPLADVPAPGLALTLRRAFGDRADAFVRVLSRARDDEPGPTETALPGYGVLSAGATWRVTKQVELRAIFDNFLDHAYPQSPDELAALAPGRSAAVSLSARF